MDTTETGGVPLDTERTTVGWSVPAWFLRELKQLALDKSTTVQAVVDGFAIEGLRSVGKPEVSAKFAATPRPKRGRPPGNGSI
jgi:hypothetical protein